MSVAVEQQDAALKDAAPKDTSADQRTRRSGGREARRAMRAAPLADDIRPVRAGLEGGSYGPLNQNDQERIHEAVLTLLETVGFANAIPSCIEALTGVGAVYGDDGRIRFPRGLVMDTIRRAARNFTLHGQDPRHDMLIQGKRVHYGTAGAAVHLVDVEKREYRESLVQDIYDAARLVEGLDNIHFFQRPMVPRDIPDPLEMDFNTLYACVMGTSKHVGTSFTVRENVQPALEMLYAIAGSEENFRARPFVSNSNCFVVPPMKFAEDACGVLEACVEGGIPILLLSAGQAGATAPAAIAGAVVQAVAEVLVGLIYVNAIKPEHPAIFGTWPFVSDLRTGAMSGGSAEQAVLTSACAQMAQFYDLPGGSAAGMTDSKLPDIQSGYEKGITDVMAGLAGLNLVYESAGMHASLLGFCLESLIIDNDMLGHCLRCVRGIEVTDEALSIDTITEVCMNGPGHYLGNEQTLRLMQTEYFYPAVGDRFSPKEWNEKGRPDILQRAIIEKKRVLAERFPRHVPKLLDDKLRARFGEMIKLPRSGMGG
ncbi:trimethylamine methyltransferase family protein [Mesorhizobium sp. C416B]|uniref:trimethylamine methyltransferase family protein n=1 Tax=unclassified Mesorhizobium TaxID=325217 RepID=UPI0003CF88BF|nr:MULTISPECIES: trimethylamine methyltransferase family protein [unclassified Mesorhizobium]ESX43486.1 methyltransferase [Mesorhizobium sp. LSHC426A00]ESX48632.1 methyltransferase [Mesorhizobium sp. LSHC424B00]ESX73559.1 methyltransferase [Mesorhizobium sp. LSHC416B00]WJI65922.1 trimethylamine methyltransferase family protein [Mesorhizobium sp. C416B]